MKLVLETERPEDVAVASAPREITLGCFEQRPHSLAVMRQLSPLVEVVREELVLGHAGDDEVEAQQIGIHPRREEHDVVALDRLAHLGFQGITVQDLLAVRPVFRA